jgi:Mn-dependent DtxR family transcriptional regulator
MSRKPQPEKLEEIYTAVEEHPGQRPSVIAQLLDVPRSTVTRSLPALEEKGYLLSEDEQGGLWPFRRQ